MANVLFKRGTKEDLLNIQQSAIIDGALYFTTDTAQLYLGHNDAQDGLKLLPIGDNIRIIESESGLGSAADHRHEFAYITDHNILAWSNGSSWVQTNPDTQTTSFTASTSTADPGKVTLTIRDSQAHSKTATFTISAATSNVSIDSTSDGTVTIGVDPDTTYALSTSAVTYTDSSATDVDILLTPSAGSTTSIRLKDSNSVNVIRDDDGSISFAVDNSGIGGISSFSMGNGNGITGTGSSSNGFYGDITGSNAAHYRSSIDPVVVYGQSGDQSAHFIGGTATLSIYTKGEIDNIVQNLERNLDAMTYRGAASTSGEVTGAENIGLGDTWKASSSFTLSAGDTTTGEVVQVEPGYLIIATGSEEDGVVTQSSLKFDVIAGDSTDTTYTISGVTVHTGTNTTTDPAPFTDTTLYGIKVTDSNGVKKGGIIVGGVKDELTASTRTATVDGQPYTEVVLGLATVTATTTTAATTTQNQGGTTTVSVVTGVAYDTYGRIEQVTITPIELIDTKLDTTSTKVTVGSSSNTATVSVIIKDTSTTGTTTGFTLGSAGQSIAVTTSSNAINIDLVWGSF